MTTMIVIEGGPRGLPRVQHISEATVAERVIVDNRGRREHLERTDSVEVVDGQQVPVFRWLYTTTSAE